MAFDLSYATPADPRWKRWTMRAIENLSGRSRFLPIYRRWSDAVAAASPRPMGELLDLVGTRLDMTGPPWPPAVPGNVPLVIVANHPFGIGDGIALLALAEQLGRPWRILINADFVRVPEIAPYSLPIDFNNTRRAIETNVASRKEARRLLQEGYTIVVFPAGGVATAHRLFGRAEELPWKTFTSRLIQEARATVLPVYFEGQNSALFHLVSRYSLTLRLSLLVSEFRHFAGANVKVHTGAPVPFEELESIRDRQALIDELYLRVRRLAPGAAALPAEALFPVPAHLRRAYPWEKPRKRAVNGGGE